MTLKEITGKSEENLTLKDTKSTTIKGVLNILAERYGKDFVEYVYDPENGQVKIFLQFLVNGKSAPTSRGLSTRLADGDVLVIMPPIAGG